jgi:hypothetical protein
MSEEESGQPKPLENPAGRTATAVLEWIETALAKPTVTQKLPLKVKNPNPLSKLYEYPSLPKEGVQTNPLRQLWLGGHPSVGGGTAPRGRWTEDDRLWFVYA